jgi:hypothetical protein
MEKNEGEHKKRTKQDIEDLKNHRDFLSSQETIPGTLEYKSIRFSSIDIDRDEASSSMIINIVLEFKLQTLDHVHIPCSANLPLSKSALSVVFKLRPFCLTPSLALSSHLSSSSCCTIQLAHYTITIVRTRYVAGVVLSWHRADTRPSPAACRPARRSSTYV